MDSGQRRRTQGSPLVRNAKSNLYSTADLGRVTQIEYPDNNTRSFVYTCCGLQSVTDEEANTTTYTYDNVGHPAQSWSF